METKYQRIGREQAERKAKREQAAKAAAKQSRRYTHRWPSSAERRIADRIDGFDRDDLSESPDY